MRILLIIIKYILAEILPLVILYEKMDNFYALNTNIYLIRKIVDEYNNFLKNINLKIVLEGVYDYTVFSEIADYSKLVEFVGLDDIQGRLNVLKDQTKNIVMLIGSVDNIEFLGYYETHPCKSRIFLNILNEIEIFPIVADGIRKWISKLLESEIPDPLDVMYKKKIFLNKEIIKKLNFCECINQITFKNIKISDINSKNLNIEINKKNDKENKGLNKDNKIYNKNNSTLNEIIPNILEYKNSVNILKKKNEEKKFNQQYKPIENINKKTIFLVNKNELLKNENPIFNKRNNKIDIKKIPYGNYKPKNGFFHNFNMNYINSSENKK